MSTEDAVKIQQAFLEAFQAGADHGNLPWKYPPANLAWLVSDARRDAGGPPLTSEQLKLIQDWHRTPFDQQQDTKTETLWHD
jgi:hypothetical protein